MDAIFNYEKKSEEDYYQILGCDELSSTEQIVAEYKTRALVCHPDKNLDDVSADENFAKLQRAKAVLSCPESRAQYDKWRRSGIHMSYEQWCAKKDSVHTSMHWASRCKKEPMIEESPSTKVKEHMSKLSEQNVTCNNFDILGWAREDNDMLKKFRNYEI